MFLDSAIDIVSWDMMIWLKVKWEANIYFMKQTKKE